MCLRLCPRLFYVKPFLERMALQTRHLIQPDVTISIDVSPKDLLVYADESLMARVVSNLLKNAAEATTSGQHISLHAFSDNDESVIIDVSDDGEPIPSDVAQHIFIPFFTTKAQGSGIGLSISRQIMRVSNGSLALLPYGSDGVTTFRLKVCDRLPLVIRSLIYRLPFFKCSSQEGNDFVACCRLAHLTVSFNA